MKRIGMDLGQLREDRPAPVIVPDCPGGRLRVSRAEYDALRAGGEHLATARQDIPFDGLGDARVLCTAKVAELPKTAAGYTQYYGLCHSCSGLEADNRANLRARAGVKGDR